MTVSHRPFPFQSALLPEERKGLGAAVILHVAVIGILLIPLGTAVREVPMPERITVTISNNVGLVSTSPEPDANPAPDFAPEIGEPQPPAAPEAPAEAVAQPPPPAPPEVAPKPAEAPKPAPVAKPKPVVDKPKPTPAAKPKPTPEKPKPAPVAKAKPAAEKPAPAAKPTAKTQTRTKTSAKQAASPASTGGSARSKADAAPAKSKAGASRIGKNFLDGIAGGNMDGNSRNSPAASAGTNVQASLSSAISRQLKPNWHAPQGADAELLVTVLSWNLNRDGSLAGKPVVVRQQGINAANRTQAERHAEMAIRAVELAAPFDLPAQYYDVWKRVSSFRFDKRLSQ